MHADGASSSFADVELIATDGLPPALALEVARGLSLRVALQCRLGAGRESFALPTLRHRDQVAADAFLARLEQEPRPPGRILVGLTARDLGHPLFTYFFGRARRHGNAAVVSLARLSPTFYGLPDDRRVTVNRAVLTVLHELGHVAGLIHCRDAACLMHFTSDVQSLDARGRSFCDACAARLPASLTEGRDRVPRV